MVQKIKLLENLNDKQYEAALDTEGKVSIVAGPGTGKTKTLVHRYAYLVKEKGIDPSEILTITFTNKAADELKERIKNLLGLKYSPSEYICTIHSLCVKILRKEIHQIGYPNNFNILDSEDCKSLAEIVMEDLNIKDVKPYDILSSVSTFKMKNDYVPKLFSGNRFVVNKNPDLLYLKYQKNYYSLDFDDLLYITRYILSNFPSSLDRWQKFKYILLDEAHDCNPVDWNILDMLSQKYGNITLLNDIDQNIYAFRGSTVDTIMGVKFDKQHILDQNYRSTKSILNVANSVIDNNKKRVKKVMFTDNEVGDKPIVEGFPNDESEAEYISTEVKKALDNGTPINEIAVMYRSSFLSRTLEQAFIKKGIKYTIWGGIRFYDRMEIKDIIAYLRVVDNSDDMSFRRIINIPARKFGSVTSKKLTDLAEKEGKTLYDTLKAHIKDKEFDKKPLVDFISLIEECRKYKGSVADLALHILDKTGLRKVYEGDKEKERLDNIVELINSIRNYEELNKNEEDVGLTGYLQEVSLYTNLDRKDDGATVRLMTIHQSKGLEFEKVFVCGVNNDILPSIRTITDRGEDGMEEERRLFYVALTRAKKDLYITYSEGYNWMTKGNKEKSPFIDEIGENNAIFLKEKKPTSKQPFKKQWNNWNYKNKYYRR